MDDIKNRQKLIQLTEFSWFLADASIYLRTKYRSCENLLIRNFLKILDEFQSGQYAQIKDYNQLLKDYPFWKERHYYRERIKKFIEYELNITDFISDILYLNLSLSQEGFDLMKDFKSQANIELDPRSFGFSSILSSLTRVLEGIDLENPNESFFTEKEFRKIIEQSSIKLEKYFIDES